MTYHFAAYLLCLAIMAISIAAWCGESFDER